MDAKHLLGPEPAEARLPGGGRTDGPTRAPSAGASSKAAWSRSATTARASPSTTKVRGIASGWNPSRWRRDRSSCGEYLAFMEDGGYRRPEFWLSAGWDCVGQRGWEAPLYWEKDSDGWQVFTLRGLKPVDPAEPVCHVSAYRGRGLRQVGRQAPAARAGVGDRRAARWRTSARSGNGPPAPTSPIPAIASRPARSASTTASSWPTRWCCAAAARRHRPAICARPIATSSRPTRAGCSAVIRLAEDLR